MRPEAPVHVFFRGGGSPRGWYRKASFFVRPEAPVQGVVYRAHTKYRCAPRGAKLVWGGGVPSGLINMFKDLRRRQQILITVIFDVSGRFSDDFQ